MGKDSQQLRWLSRLGIVFLVVSALYFARDVFVPLALATLIAFLLNPLVKILQRLHLGRIPSVVLSLVLAITLVGSLFYYIGREMASLIAELPRYRTELVTKVRGLGGIGSEIGASLDSIRAEMTDALRKKGQEGESKSSEDSEPNGSHTSLTESESKDQELQNKSLNSDYHPDAGIHDGSTADTPLYTTEVQNTPIPFIGWATSASYILGPMGTAALVVVFALFMMVYQDELRDRLIRMVSRGQYVTSTRAINEAAERIIRYLVAQTIVNSTYGAVIAIGLWLIGEQLGQEHGFPNVLLWGFLCMVLRFIPYLGFVIAAAFPIVLSIAVFPGFSVFLAVVILISVVELLCNNLMEPWFYGASTGVSPMAIIFSAVFWGWLWGPVGLLLATPLTVCLVVLGKHVEQFRIFKALLAESEPMPQAIRFYQRLLARDEVQASRMAKQQFDSDGAIPFFDSTLIPSMRRIRRDRNAKRLSASDEKDMLQLIDRLTESLNQEGEQNAVSSTPDETQVTEFHQPRIVSIAAHNAFEELLLRRCFERLEGLGVKNEVLPVKTSLAELEDNLTANNPDVVIVGLMPPGGLAQTEYLCEQIRNLLPKCKILVMFFGRVRRFDRLLVRLRRVGASYVVPTVALGTTYIESVIKTRTKLPAKTLKVNPIPEVESLTAKGV